ncbi:MAG: hypothetical protein NTV49_15335, partial [Kiritimatiellaeota bacterium]|nr:hypothetical protein [Kiritimatiellota bacterium]
DLANARDLGLLAKAVETQVFAVATVSVLDAKVLLPGGREQLDLHHLRGLWNVEHAEDNRLRVLME